MLKTLMLAGGMALTSIPAFAATFNTSLFFMQDIHVDTRTYRYEGNRELTPYSLDENLETIEELSLEYSFKDGHGNVTIELAGFEKSKFSIEYLNGEPFFGYYLCDSDREDVCIYSRKFDADLLDGRNNFATQWDGFSFHARPKGPTEIFPSGFILYASVVDWGDNIADPLNQRGTYNITLIPLPVPASGAMLAGVLWLFAFFRRRRPA